MNCGPLKDERPRINVEQLIARLRAFNAWRRGGDGEQPSPAIIGADIDEVIGILERLATPPAASDLDDDTPF